jgi:8-oxo-dGTP pyrophosphatase MutT (NUDIX family)
MSEATKLHAVCWLLIHSGYVVLEQCPKKAAKLGVGEWFVPGGKIEGDESPAAACRREIHEEWGAIASSLVPLPIIEGSPIPPKNYLDGPFLMRPFRVGLEADNVPRRASNGVLLRWVPIDEALASPVVQVRMMVAGAVGVRS